MHINSDMQRHIGELFVFTKKVATEIRMHSAYADIHWITWQNQPHRSYDVMWLSDIILDLHSLGEHLINDDVGGVMQSCEILISMYESYLSPHRHYGLKSQPKETLDRYTNKFHLEDCINTLRAIHRIASAQVHEKAMRSANEHDADDRSLPGS